MFERINNQSINLVWSVVGEATDHVAWTAARLCGNWWTRLQTVDVTIWLLCGDFIFDAVSYCMPWNRC